MIYLLRHPGRGPNAFGSGACPSPRDEQAMVDAPGVAPGLPRVPTCGVPRGRISSAPKQMNITVVSMPRVRAAPRNVARMATSSYEVTARSSAPPERLFELISDAPGWPRWAGPLIGHGSWEREGTPPPGGVGAIRKIGRWPQY